MRGDFTVFNWDHKPSISEPHKMKHALNRLSLLFVVMLVVVASTATAEESSQLRAGWELEAKILKRIQEPKFPKRDFIITQFGAVADGKTDCTEAIAKAIDACSEKGGGRVVVPAGEFLTGAIHLKSDVNLHLDAKAVLKFVTDPHAYLPLVFTRFEGTELYNYSPFIYALGQKTWP